jgi:hypothetical protein
VSKVRADRVDVARQGTSKAARRRTKSDPEESFYSAVLEAGNRAVAGLLAPGGPVVQRKVGWTNAVKDGYAWNDDERETGKLKTIRRIPLEAFGEGLEEERAVTPVRKGDKWVAETRSTKIKELTPESAVDRAIVLVPKALDAAKPIEVLVFLHGHTEGTHRPFAGWRTLPVLPTGRPKGSAGVETLRKGIDAQDVAPVRDVALDDASQQLEDSGFAQMVIVLPQGGLHSQFGKGKPGDYSFDSGTYVRKVVDQLQTDDVWKDAGGRKATAAPKVARVSMAGHSGAGSTLRSMAKESVKPGAGKGPWTKGGTWTLTGDLVLYDAINSPDQRQAFADWALMHLNNALIVLTSTTLDDATKFKYLSDAQKLRSYASGGDYQTENNKLKGAIEGWFKTNARKLGKFEAALRSNFVVKNVNEGRKDALEHEEMMRGAKAGKARAAGTGGILDALKALHRP